MSDASDVPFRTGMCDWTCPECVASKETFEMAEICR
jgi:rubredoxin